MRCRTPPHSSILQHLNDGLRFFTSQMRTHLPANYPSNMYVDVQRLCAVALPMTHPDSKGNGIRSMLRSRGGMSSRGGAGSQHPSSRAAAPRWSSSAKNPLTNARIFGTNSHSNSKIASTDPSHLRAQQTKVPRSRSRNRHRHRTASHPKLPLPPPPPPPLHQHQRHSDHDEHQHYQQQHQQQHQHSRRGSAAAQSTSSLPEVPEASRDSGMQQPPPPPLPYRRKTATSSSGGQRLRSSGNGRGPDQLLEHGNSENTLQHRFPSASTSSRQHQHYQQQIQQEMLPGDEPGGGGGGPVRGNSSMRARQRSALSGRATASGRRRSGGGGGGGGGGRPWSRPQPQSQYNAVDGGGGGSGGGSGSGNGYNSTPGNIATAMLHERVPTAKGTVGSPFCLG